MKIVFEETIEIFLMEEFARNYIEVNTSYIHEKSNYSGHVGIKWKRLKIYLKNTMSDILKHRVTSNGILFYDQASITLKIT